MNKKILRQQAQKQRAALSNLEVRTHSEQIIARVINFIDWAHQHTIHIYLPQTKSHEVDTWPLLQYLWAKQPYIAVATNRMQLTSSEVTCCLIQLSSLYKLNPWGIPEPTALAPIAAPAQITTIIIPLLACDHNGNRLGYGKGYYDRLLAQCSANTLKVGINYFPPLETFIPCETHDQPIDYLITPDHVFAFS